MWIFFTTETQPPARGAYAPEGGHRALFFFANDINLPHLK